MTEPPDRELTPYRLLRDPMPAAPVSYPTGPSSVDRFRDYWRVIVGHRRVIAAMFAVTVVATAVVSFNMEPLYSATATIQIDRQAPKVAPVQGVEAPDAAPTDKYDFYQTQFGILKSRSVAARVIRGLGLETDPRFIDRSSVSLLGSVRRWVRAWFPKKAVPGAGRENGVESGIVTKYLDDLTIVPIRNSRLVRVSFTSRDPALSAAVANRHVEEFVNANLQGRMEVTGRGREFLEEELAKAKERVDAAEATLNDFRKAQGIVSLSGDASDIVSARLSDLNEKFTEAQADRIRLEGEYRLIENKGSDSLPAVTANPVVQRLREEVAQVASHTAKLSEVYGPQHPKLAVALARERRLNASLDAEVSRIVETVRSGYQAARNREEELGRQLAEQRTAALAQKDVGADFGTLEREASTMREIYASLLQRLKDIDVAGELRTTNISTVDAATIPERPTKPRILMNLALASAIGLLLGVGFAFVLDYMDDTIPTPELVRQRLGLATLGVVPAFDRPVPEEGVRRRIGRPSGRHADPRPGTELVTLQDRRSLTAEAYRTIQTGVLMSALDEPIKVIVFTSSFAAEGKTVTAVNEALTIALAGGRVLLVDADVRKPRIHRVFGLENGGGLSTVLTGQASLESLVREVSLNGHAHSPGATEGRLFVLPSGPCPPDPPSLLGSRRMRETLGRLREEYDFVILDTAPVLPVSDTIRLSFLADGVVLVVRGQQTPHRAVNESRNRLQQARARVLGVVLNDVNLQSSDYYGSSARYYTDYGEAGANT